MVTRITSGIKISVETNYKGRYVSSDGPLWVFHYHVTISNQGNRAVKLLHRHWNIWDSGSSPTEVEGDGVIGLKPEIVPGETHRYQSGCHLRSGIGYMKGSYQMEDLVTGNQFEVTIPLFQLIAPQRLN